MVKCVVEYAMSGNTCLRILIGVWDIRILEVYGTYVRPLEDICTEHREQKLSFALDYL